MFDFIPGLVPAQRLKTSVSHHRLLRQQMIIVLMQHRFPQYLQTVRVQTLIINTHLVQPIQMLIRVEHVQVIQELLMMMFGFHLLQQQLLTYYLQHMFQVIRIFIGKFFLDHVTLL